LKVGHPAVVLVAVLVSALAQVVASAAGLKYPGMGELLIVYSVLGSSVAFKYARG